MIIGIANICIIFFWKKIVGRLFCIGRAQFFLRSSSPLLCLALYIMHGYECYTFFGRQISGSLFISSVLWVASSHNTFFSSINHLITVRPIIKNLFISRPRRSQGLLYKQRSCKLINLFCHCLSKRQHRAVRTSTTWQKTYIVTLD